MVRRFSLTLLTLGLLLLLNGCSGSTTEESLASNEPPPPPTPAAPLVPPPQPPAPKQPASSGMLPAPIAPTQPVAAQPEGDFNPFAPAPKTASGAGAPQQPAPQAPAAQSLSLTIANPADNGMSLADAIEFAERSVVRIKVYLPDGEGLGSGFVAGGDGTLIVTNYHVVDGCLRAEVTFRDGQLMEVQGVRAHSENRDLAVLQIAPQNPARPELKLFRGSPRKGETVIALGAPRGFAFTASDGIVSGVRDGIEMRNILGPGFRNDLSLRYVQSTTPISPGNSGGPLVNLQGEVVGINTFCRTDSQNLNFAVSAEHAVEIVTAAMRNELMALHTLPRRAQLPEVPGPRRFDGNEGVGPSESWDVALPDGKHFSSALCTLDSSRLSALRGSSSGLSGTAPPAVVEYASGKPHAIAWHKNGVLDGTLVAVTETGKPKVVAQYEDGKIDENLIVADDSGQLQFFSQFEKGRLDGFRCQFSKGQPLLIAQHSKDRLTALHLVHEGKVVKSFASADAIGADDKEAAAAHALLLKSVEEFAAEERALRKAVREIDLDERQARAAVLNVEKRARERARGEARAAASREIYNSLRRQSGF